MKRLAIVTTHPIQYYAPVFKLLNQSAEISIKVFYTWGEGSANKYDPGFNKKIKWDVPLFEGYSYEWVKNSSKDPGTHHFKGVINHGLIDQVKAWNPDFILFYGWGFQSHLKAIRHFKNKIPVLFRGDSNLLDEKSGARLLLRAVFLKWVYRNVDHAFYVGTNNKAYYKSYGLKEAQLTFAPHAIDNKKFAVDRRSDATLLRKKLGINDAEIVVLFAGKLEEKKDPLLLLSAFLGLDIDGAHLLIVGNGPLERKVKDNARSNRNIHFMDFQNQSQMPAVYQSCDIFCLPSKGPGETWGLAINEAMASGKAILASDKVGAAADLVKNDKNGTIFKAGDLTDLIYHLDKLLQIGKKGLIKLGECSKQIIQDWDIERQVEAIGSFIKHG